jgi:hypothetical protein
MQISDGLDDARTDLFSFGANRALQDAFEIV